MSVALKIENLPSVEPEQSTYAAIMVDLTHRCNMECANCYLPNRDIPDMDTKRLYDLLRRLPQRTYIRLVGAEPTLREDLFDIIRAIKDMGHHVSLITNGLKLAHEEYVLGLKTAGLRQACISMNGADDDELYQQIDNGRYATLKTRALDHLMHQGFIVSTATNIARGVNEDAIAAQVALVGRMLDKHGRRKIKPLLRFRTIGAIGRYMGDDRTYDFDDFIDAVAVQLGIARSDITDPQLRVWNNGPGVVFEYGDCWIRLVDWAFYDEVDDLLIQSRRRGRLYRNYSARITPDFKLAPYFLHVKANEFGY